MPLFCWPPAARRAQPAPAPLSAEELLAAHNARIHEAMGSIDGVPPLRRATDLATMRSSSAAGTGGRGACRSVPSEPEPGDAAIG